MVLFLVQQVLQVVFAHVLLVDEHTNEPGYCLWLFVLSYLPVLALIMHFIWNKASLYYFLFNAYTISVIASCFLGILGPYLTKGAWWNYTCMKQEVDSTLGKYEIVNECQKQDLWQLLQVIFRLPFQIYIIFKLHQYHAVKRDEESHLAKK